MPVAKKNQPKADEPSVDAKTKEKETEKKPQEETAEKAVPAAEPKAAEPMVTPTPTPAVPQAPVPQPTPTLAATPIPVPKFVPRPMNNQRPPAPAPRPMNPVEAVAGFLDTSSDGHGVLRPHFSPSERDVYISSMVIRRLGLRPGDFVEGTARKPNDNERYWGLMTVSKVNSKAPTDLYKRIKFHNLTPIYPNQKIKLETSQQPLSTRLIDLVAPVGRGQRGMIVSPPKAGKTTIMKDIITGIAANYPEIHLMAVLIGERPEEVTDIRRHLEAVTKNSEIPGECAASNFDEPAEDQTRVAEVALERAKRLVEEGKDVVIVLDSITRLARAYNLAIPTSGRTLSGGFDPAALYPPKKFFGAARKMEGGGSLTILGTALVDTGSRMDELVYEEFKGTGNMELMLDRRLAERRVFPAIDVVRSGTRREDLLYSSSEYQNVILLRRMIDLMNQGGMGNNDNLGYVQDLVNRLGKTKSNKEFLANLKEG